MTPEDRARALPLTGEIRGAILPQQAGAAMSNDFTVGDIMRDEDRAYALPIMGEVHQAILPRVVPVAAVRAVRVAEGQEEPEPEPEPEPERVYSEIEVYQNVNKGVFDNDADGAGDGVTGTKGNWGWKIGAGTVRVTPAKWGCIRRVLVYRTSMLPDSIISAHFAGEINWVTSPLNPFTRWGSCYVAHFNKTTVVVLPEDYQVTCADLDSLGGLGSFSINVTAQLKNDQETGKAYSAFKMYFKTNENGAEFSCYATVPEAPILKIWSYE